VAQVHSLAASKGRFAEAFEDPTTNQPIPLDFGEKQR
jgi:hypothetical protein